MTRKIDELPEHERLRLVGMIAGGTSWRQLAREFDIPSTTIHDWAKEKGVTKTPTQAKKNMVDSLLLCDIREVPERSEWCSERSALITTGNEIVDAAAERDFQIVGRASWVAVLTINRLLEIYNTEQPDAKTCLAIATANDKAIATYTRINKLDDAPKEEIVLQWVDPV